MSYNVEGLMKDKVGRQSDSECEWEVIHVSSHPRGFEDFPPKGSNLGSEKTLRKAWKILRIQQLQSIKAKPNLLLFHLC